MLQLFPLIEVSQGLWRLDIISPFWKKIRKRTSWGSTYFSKTRTNAQPVQRGVGLAMRRDLISIPSLCGMNTSPRRRPSSLFIARLYAWYYSECLTAVSHLTLPAILWCYKGYIHTSQLNKWEMGKLRNLTQVIYGRIFFQCRWFEKLQWKRFTEFSLIWTNWGRRRVSRQGEWY